MNNDLPTLKIATALRDLLQRNERTRGRGVGEMFLLQDTFVVTLTRPQVVEGQSWPVDTTVDVMDLMDMEAQERRL